MINLEVNPNREYMICADISVSMQTNDPQCGSDTRYRYMLEKLKMFIKTAEDYDSHGQTTVLLFGEQVHVHEHMESSKVNRLLDGVEFEGMTNLHLAIERAYQLHRDERIELAAKKEIHPGTQLIIFTDGDPSNKPAVARVLAKIVGEIDREEEFQVHILTVGTVPDSLNTYLANLHDDLEDRKVNPRDFDIIHVSKLEEVNFMGVVAANRHGDKA